MGETGENMRETKEDMRETREDVEEAGDDMRETREDIEETEEDEEKTGEDGEEIGEDMEETGEDMEETEEDMEGTDEDTGETSDFYVEDIGETKPEFDPLMDVVGQGFKARMAELEPPIVQTVCLTSPDHWSIGSQMICEIVNADENIPPDAVCSWIDHGATYCLRKRPTPRLSKDPEGDFKGIRFQGFAGPSRCISNLSPDVFCKVKAWTEGLTTEATTIRWVNKNIPSIPTEQIIYDWVEPEWSRAIMISKRVPGVMYQDAWISLTTQQKLHVADEVAKHLKSLSEYTSDYVETVQGTGVQGKWSLREREFLPLCKPRVEPRVSREEYEAYNKRNDMRGKLEVDLPGIGEPLVLQHSDCSPTNFLVTVPSGPNEMPVLTGIIDWEVVGYFPKWHVAYYPRVSEFFRVELVPYHKEGQDWQWMLSNACVKLGFPLELEYLMEQCRRWMKYFPKLQIGDICNVNNLPAEASQNDMEN